MSNWSFPPPIPGARNHWMLDPSVRFLNHGSFGATPVPVLAVQSEWRARMEREPVLFLHRESEALLDEARAEVARFIGADPEGLSFINNATSGVNTILRCFRLNPKDEIIVTNQGYNACNNAARAVAEASGARVVVAEVPWPCTDPEEVTAAILDCVSPRTRLLIADHVTSSTGVIWPIDAIIRTVRTRDIPVLVDGAHAPGMVPIDIAELEPAFYTGNLHKWCCAPKGSAFLWIHPDYRDVTVPLTISHGRNSTRQDRSRHRLMFDWTGTYDPSAWLSVPHALRFLESLVPGGWPELMIRHRATALAARSLLRECLQTGELAPESMVGSLACVELPPPRPGSAVAAAQPMPPLELHPLQVRLWTEYRIEVPVTPFPKAGRFNLRISAAPHNTPADYHALVDALRREGYGKA